MRSLMVYPHEIEQGDVVVAGNRVYEIEGTVKPWVMGYSRVMVRNVDNGTRHVREFKCDRTHHVIRVTS